MFVRKEMRAAASMIESGVLDAILEELYAGWNTREANKILLGEMDLNQIFKYVKDNNVDPSPKSGKQEYIENIVNRVV